jgi:hypothetical protein
MTTSIRRRRRRCRTTQFYKTRHEHIGEAQPLTAEGTCAHPFLVPSVNRTACVLPGRMDVGRHLIMHGGVLGLKESLETLSSRVQSFGAYRFDIDKMPVVQRLFASPTFVGAAQKICPASKPFLDPFQFNFIIQVRAVPPNNVRFNIDCCYTHYAAAAIDSMF